MQDDFSEKHGIQGGEPAGGESAAVRPAEENVENEAALIRKAQADPLAFGELYEAYYSRILNYAYRGTLDRSIAEELTSNTFFKALRGLKAYVPRTPFRSWLYRIATNEVRMHWRKEKMRRFCGLGTRSEPPEEGVTFAAPEVELREASRAQARQYARLHDLLLELPVKYQAPLRLRYVEQLALEEIAHVLGKRLGTVKSLIHRGLARLRSRAEQDATFREDANCREMGEAYEN